MYNSLLQLFVAWGWLSESSRADQARRDRNDAYRAQSAAEEARRAAEEAKGIAEQKVEQLKSGLRSVRGKLQWMKRKSKKPE